MSLQVICDLCGKEIPTDNSVYVIEIRRKDPKTSVGGLEVCEDCKNRIVEFLPIDCPDRELFKRKRIFLGLSQQQLAKECNLSQGTISALENGYYASPITITRVGNVLNRIAKEKGMRICLSK